MAKPVDTEGRNRLTWLLGGRSLTVIALCALLGLAIITQVRQQPEDAIRTMRQDDLVRLLDELGTRSDDLAQESQVLEQRLDELKSGAKSQQAAKKAADEQARNRSILAGTVPVHGPGITLTVIDNDNALTAQMMVTVLEELRNAGAEAIEVNAHRLTTSSWFQRDDTTLIVDGEELSAPFVFNAIGDSHTLALALDIPGGALATIRNAGARPTVTSREDIEIRSVRESPELKYSKLSDRP